MQPSEIMATVLRASLHYFSGRLGRDPEIKYLESGRIVASASMAINRPGSKRDDGQAPDWFDVELWGDQAQAFSDECRKGDQVLVVGRVKTNRWTNRTTGEEQMKLVVTADAWRKGGPEVGPIGQAPAAPAAASAAQPAAPAPTAAPAPAAVPVWQSSSDDIPF